MGSSAILYIEYRRKGEPGWNLYHTLVPITKEKYDEEMAEAKNFGYSADHLIVREEPYSGLDTYYVNRDCIVGNGYLRDSLSRRGMYADYDDDMLNKGLPDDASLEMKAWDESVKERCNGSYDWRGQINWFTLDSLADYSDKLFNRIMEHVKDYVNKIIEAGVKTDLSEIKGKLESMELTLEEIRSGKAIPHESKKGKARGHSKDEDYDTVEDCWANLEEMLESDVSQYSAVNGFYNTVETIIERFVAADYDDQIETRIIYYIA